MGTRRHRGDPAELESVQCWFRLIAHALNYLGSGFGAAGAVVPPTKASPAQEKAMLRLAETLEWFLSEDEQDPRTLQEVFKEARAKKTTYGGEVVTNRRALPPFREVELSCCRAPSLLFEKCS